MRSGTLFSRSRKHRETNDSADVLQEAPALFLIQNHALNRKEKSHDETNGKTCRADDPNDTAEPYYLLMELTGAEGKPTLRALREVRLDRD